MVIGVKCADQLASNHIPVMFSKGKFHLSESCFFLFSLPRRIFRIKKKLIFMSEIVRLDMTNPRLAKGNLS